MMQTYGLIIISYLVNIESISGIKLKITYLERLISIEIFEENIRSSKTKAKNLI
jgi:hypothetical protein